MTPEEMASDEMKKLREKFVKESINDAQLVMSLNFYLIFIIINIAYLLLDHTFINDASWLLLIFYFLRKHRRQFKARKQICLNVASAKRRIVLIINCKRDPLMNLWRPSSYVMLVETDGNFAKLSATKKYVTTIHTYILHASFKSK